jgi:hypothetical protein
MKTKIIAQDSLTEAAALDEAKQKKVVSSDSKEPASSPEPQAVTLSMDQLQALVNTKVEEATAGIRTQLQQTQEQLNQTQQEKNSLDNVFKVLGVNVNTRVAASADRPSGLAKDFMSACDSAPAAIWVNRSTGERFIQRDMSQARHLFYTERQQLRSDIEKLARDNGLLMGNRGMIASDATTVKSDILPTLLDYMSLVLRETHSGRYVYWQFPFYQLQLGRGPGDTIQVPRFRWLPEAATLADRTLTPGTNLNVNNQNITALAVSLTLGERGLGLNATFPPVAIPEFLTAYSMLNLENAVMTRLGHDYEAWEDLSIRARYFATTRIVYNDRQSVTTTPGSVGANDDGTFTEAFANMLYAYMSGLQIPTLDDGCYCLVLHDTALAQFKNSLSIKNRVLEQGNPTEITMMFQAASNREQGKTSGYAGKACGFHVFGTNTHSLGIAGTQGAQNETLGVGSTLTRTSLAFGRAAVARAIGMEAEIRRDNNDDFGRLNRFTWLSHEVTGDLDVDSAINAEQQLRVIQVRTTDISL